MSGSDERAFGGGTAVVREDGDSAAAKDSINGRRGGKIGVKEARMSVNLIFKIAAVGILVSVLSQVLKHSGREEQAFLTSLAGLLLVLFWIVPYIYDLFEDIRRLFSL